MRKLCLIFAVAVLVAPAVVFAADRTTGDGSLSVAGASGTIVIQGRGVVYGHFDQGTLMVLDYRPDDPASTASISTGKLKYPYVKGPASFTANDVRFLFPSGRYTLELVSTGIDISAVGRGSVVATAGAVLDAGTLAVNGAKPQPLLVRGSTSAVFGKTILSVSS
jgi:hypothetical protein